jgi:hypothetical protein
MRLDCLPEVLFDGILAQLNLYEKRLLTRSSKTLAKVVWGRFPTVRARYSIKDHTQTLKLFHCVDSVLPDSTPIKKITAISQNPFRSTALAEWINSQHVCIDGRGFFTPNEGYRGTEMTRIRIKMWDRPLGYKRKYYHHGNNYGYEMVPHLKPEFVRMGYNP